MKHIRTVSIGRAAAFGDFIASVQRAYSDFVFAKLNQAGGEGGGVLFSGGDGGGGGGGGGGGEE